MADLVPFALRNILESETFSRSPRLRQFLSFLVDEELAGRGGRLNGTQIAIDVYRRNVSFDPRTDPVVRTEAGRLRRALERYYLTGGGDDRVRIDIPKGRYRPKFSLQSEKHVEEPADCPPVSGRKEETNPADISWEGYPVIAVLPFQHSGGEKENYFAQGFAAALMSALTRFRFIRVAAQPFGVSYQGVVDLREIGQHLGAAFVLTGDVRCGKDNIRIRVALSDTRDGIQLWAETYDRPSKISDMFELEDELTRAVTAYVGDLFGVIPKATNNRKTRDKAPKELNSYEAGMRFLAFVSQFRREDLSPAREALEAALDQKPQWTIGWACLAILCFFEYTHEISENNELPRHIQEYANRAAALSPKAPAARFALAVAAFVANKPERVTQEAEKAIQLNPYSAFNIGYAGYLIGLAGDLKRGIQLLQEAEKLNPHYPSWLLGTLFLDFYCKGCYQEALSVAERYTVDEWHGKPLCLAVSLSQLGRFEEAKEQIRQLKQIHPGFALDPEKYVRRNFLIEEHIKPILDGLEKVGL